MKLVDELDTNKDGKLSLDEFLKIAEPPFSADVPGGPTLEERRGRARPTFQSFDINGRRLHRTGRSRSADPGRVQYVRYRPRQQDQRAEIRLIMQRLLQRQAAERQQMEAERRQGLMAINDLIDMQMRDADKLDKNNDGKISQQEYLALAGPADGAASPGPAALRVRKQLMLRKFQAIDTNKDGVIDRLELTAYAVKEFLGTDLDKDRFLDQEEIKKSKEADAARTREIVHKLLPAPSRPAPPAPPGLPQRTR